MNPLKHPAEINPFQQYRQAKQIYRKTSRAKNPDWYRDALDLDYQLHIRTDGAGVSAYLYDKKENLWAHGPALTEAKLLDPEAMVAYAGEAVKHVRSTGGSSLGVILHIADEFSLTEIKPEFEDREALLTLREAAANDPASILADSVDPEHSSWRILPYFSPESPAIATAVTISRRHDPMLAAIRELGNTEDFPVITAALSSPLIALTGLPDATTRTEGKPCVAILQYPHFTVLAAFDANSDLLLVRTQLHRGLRRPPNFRHTIATTNASLELVDPDLYVFPLGEEVDRSLIADLGITFTKSHLELVSIPDVGTLPPWCPECILSTRVADEERHLPGITFRALPEEKWALQDFLSPSAETIAAMPARSEMTLLRFTSIIRIAAAVIALGIVGWIGTALYKIGTSDAWAFDPAQSDVIKKRLTMLNAERLRTEHWDNLLEDRSKGWIVMESLSRLFPENSGVLVSTFSYSARPDTSPGQAKVGFVKEWKITGLAKDEAVEVLNTLNSREGIAAHFNSIADLTGNSAYRTDIGTRSVVVNIRTQENPAFSRTTSSADDLANGPSAAIASFPSTFDLAITQRFEATDPLAITVAKAP